jgi:hypothetical protein
MRVHRQVKCCVWSTLHVLAFLPQQGGLGQHFMARCAPLLIECFLHSARACPVSAFFIVTFSYLEVHVLTLPTPPLDTKRNHREFDRAAPRCAPRVEAKLTRLKPRGMTTAGTRTGSCTGMRTCVATRACAHASTHTHSNEAMSAKLATHTADG